MNAEPAPAGSPEHRAGHPGAGLRVSIAQVRRGAGPVGGGVLHSQGGWRTHSRADRSRSLQHHLRSGLRLGWPLDQGAASLRAAASGGEEPLAPAVGPGTQSGDIRHGQDEHVFARLHRLQLCHWRHLPKTGLRAGGLAPQVRLCCRQSHVEPGQLR